MAGPEILEDPEELGVIAALDRLCTLESRLRQAIQSTHTINRSFGRDISTVDREREALLMIREHLEIMEDKLRDYRTMRTAPKNYDDKAIALSQLDSLRKDLLRASKDRIDYVLYNKDVVKDILAFADTDSSDDSMPAHEFDNGHDTGHEISHMSSPSHFSEGNNSYIPYAEDSSAHQLQTQNGATSPRDLRFQLDGHMDEFQENTFPYPAPASTPGINHLMNKGFNRSQSGSLAQTVAGSKDPLSNLHDNEYTQHSTRPEAKTYRPGGAGHTAESAVGSYLDDYAYSMCPPSSAVGSSDPQCVLPVHLKDNDDDSYGYLNGSKYSHDPNFGGKLSLSGFKGREVGLPPKADVLESQNDRPRIVHDSTYADEQSRLLVARQEEGAQEAGGEQSGERGVNPIQSVMQRRAAAQQIQGKACRERRRSRLASFVGSCLRIALAAAVATAVTVTISSAADFPKYVREMPLPSKRQVCGARPQKPKSHPADRNIPQADGHLVPEWMHKTKFKSSQLPPTGVLTATSGPPFGEMFPVIPPPAIKHAKG